MTINITTGDPSAKPAGASTMVVGSQVPITLTLDASPGSGAAFALTLGTASSDPAIVAYCGSFVQQDETTWTGVLDGTDSRLVTAMSGFGSQAFNAQVSWTLNGGEPFICPNFAVTVQQINGAPPETTEGGPTYVTTTMLTAAIATALAGAAKIDGSGNILIGTNARLVPTGTGFKAQVSLDGSTWQDAQTYAAT